MHSIPEPTNSLVLEATRERQSHHLIPSSDELMEVKDPTASAAAGIIGNFDMAGALQGVNSE
jgi:hypothetical protein